MKGLLNKIFRNDIILYDGDNIQITLREILLTIIISLFLLMCGNSISQVIENKIEEKNENLNTALKIEDEDSFAWALQTNPGYAFVYGKLTTETPLIDKNIKGEWIYLYKDYKHYTQHTRTVTHSNGKTTWTTTEIYYTWDTIKTKSDTANNVAFCGQGGLPLTYDDHYIKSVRIDSDDKIEYYGTKNNVNGTIYTTIKDNKIKKTKFYETTIKKYMNFKKISYKTIFIIFWIIWIFLIIILNIVIIAFDNYWLD